MSWSCTKLVLVLICNSSHLFTKGGTFVVASNGSALVKINNHAATYEIALVFEGALPGNALLKNLVLNQAPSLAFSKLRFSLTFLTLFLTWLVLKGKFYQTEVNYRFHRKLYLLATVPTFPDCPSGVARPAKQPEFQLVLHQG